MSASLEKIIALCKRRGFVYPTAEIYGGLNGVYDTGPLGTLVKENLRNLWKKSLTKDNLDIVFIEGSLLSPEIVWKASGHLDNFQDPMIDCLNCKKRFRADEPEIDIDKSCPSCGVKNWTEVRQFNLMFKTQIGATENSNNIGYLRPETAQSIFINFKNVYSTSRVKIPFGIAQIGKAFRNEINPKQFLFRVREFEQMEMEWFCKAEDTNYYFDLWLKKRYEFYKTVGINLEKIRLRAHEQTELSHYSSMTSDVEYLFPFGWKELEGIAYRSDYDLSQHMKTAGKDLSVYSEETKSSFVPHVVECSVGTDRLFLTTLFDSYYEDNVDSEIRIVLRLDPKVAPYKAAFLPLTKQQVGPMQALYDVFKDKYSIQFDSTGSIGKRYRRQDEIGTPICFTYDFDSESQDSVTVRHRDSMSQERIAINEIGKYLEDLLSK